MLAYGIISTPQRPQPHLGVRFNKQQVIDLAELAANDSLKAEYVPIVNSSTLNDLISHGRGIRNQFKQLIEKIITTQPQHQAIYALSEVTVHHPLHIGGYTDFYASKQHATNIGKIFRPTNPLLPNWQYLPIAYNGRASSVVISGHSVKRPHGQILSGEIPQVSPSQKLDFEVELGIIIGKASKLGEPIAINQADDYIFGVCLVNDWSARDIQAWEYQPLGPFTSKSFLTSISSFITPIEELEHCKTTAVSQQPQPFAYLADPEPHSYDIEFTVKLKTSASPAGITIATTNFKHIYWTMRQWIAQHTVTGCNLQVGDLLASGTISGDEANSLGSLMELTINGKQPLTLPNGEQRSFLNTGDELIIEAYAGSERSYLGEVSGKIID